MWSAGDPLSWVAFFTQTPRGDKYIHLINLEVGCTWLILDVSGCYHQTNNKISKSKRGGGVLPNPYFHIGMSKRLCTQTYLFVLDIFLFTSSFQQLKEIGCDKVKDELVHFHFLVQFYFLVQKHSFQCLVIVKLFNTQWATHTNVSYARSSWVRGSALRTMRRHTICQRRQSTVAHIVHMKCQRSTEATWKDILRIRTSTNSKL